MTNTKKCCDGNSDINSSLDLDELMKEIEADDEDNNSENENETNKKNKRYGKE